MLKGNWNVLFNLIKWRQGLNFLMAMKLCIVAFDIQVCLYSWILLLAHHPL